MFSSLQLYSAGVAKDSAEHCRRYSGCPELANSTVDSSPERTTSSTPEDNSTLQTNACTSSNARGNTSYVSETRATNMSCVREKITSLILSTSAVDIVMASWRKGTKTQYQSYLSKWIKFCSSEKCNFLSAAVSIGVEFLASLYASGYSYSSINTATSALSSLLQSNPPFGQQPLVKRFMKGVFELKPSLPRYSEIWDISLVFNFIRRQPELEKITLKALTCQLTFLLLILSGQRCQTIQLLLIENLTMNDEHCIFYICESVKQTRPGTHIPPIQFLSYKHDKKLCVVQHIKDYLARTKQKRQATCIDRDYCYVVQRIPK